MKQHDYIKKLNNPNPKLNTVENLHYIFNGKTNKEIAIFLLDNIEKLYNEKKYELIEIYIDNLLPIIDELSKSDKNRCMDRLEVLSDNLKDTVNLLFDRQKSLKNNLIEVIDKIDTPLKLYKEERIKELQRFNYSTKLIEDARCDNFILSLGKNNIEYINCYNEKNDSLFIYIVKKYIETKDIYYLQVISKLLEVKELNITKSDYNYIKSLIKSNNNPYTELLGEIINHYLSIRNNRLCVSNVITSCKKNIDSSNISLKDISLIDRVDLRELDTISIDFASKKGANVTNIDDAISLEVSQSGYKIYIHVADVPEFIKDNTILNYKASHQMEHLYLKNKSISLYDKDLVTNYISLKELTDRLAITIELNFDTSLNLISSSIYESIINVNKNYSSMEANTLILNESDYLLNTLYSITKHLRSKRLDKTYTPLSGLIVEELSILANLTIAKTFASKNYPFIYKNHLGSLDEDEIYKTFATLTYDILDKEDAHKMVSFYGKHPVINLLYAPIYIEHISFNAPYAESLNPERHYISLENLRIIKDILIHDKNNQDYWFKRALIDSIIGNATNMKLLKAENNIHKLTKN